MQILDSLVDGPLELSDEREGDELIGMVVRYLRTGKVPEPRTDAQRMAVTMMMPVLEKSRARVLAGSKGGSGGSSKSQSSAQSKSSSKSASKTPSKSESKEESKRASDQDSSFLIPSSSSGEGVQGEGPERPTRDEVRAHWESEHLEGDPDGFWATYEAKGWVDGNGQPVRSWRALALKWSLRQKAMRPAAAASEQRAPAPRPVAELCDLAGLRRAEREYREAYGDEPVRACGGNRVSAEGFRRLLKASEIAERRRFAGEKVAV